MCRAGEPTIGDNEMTSIEPKDWPFDRVSRLGKGQASPFVVVIGSGVSLLIEAFDFEALSALEGPVRLSQDLTGDQPPIKCVGFRKDDCRNG